MLSKIQFVIVDGPDEGAQYDFYQEEITIGSDFSNDLILNHFDIQGQHLRVFEENNDVYLEETNGKPKSVKLNGLMVSREILHNGDELQIGPYVFHLSLIQEELSAEALGDEPSGGGGSSIGRRSFFLLAFIGIFCIVGIYGGLRFMAEDTSIEDLSRYGPLTFPVKGIFGYQVGGQNYVDKVEFSFTAKQPKYRLKYKPGFINKARMVQIFINEKKLANVPLTVNRWFDKTVTLEIAQADLMMDEINIIRFDNVANPTDGPGKMCWGIMDVSIQEVPVPKCDIKVAQKYFHLAQEKYNEKQIIESNLYFAINHLKAASEYVFSCKDEEIRNQIQEAITKYENELRDILSGYKFNCQKFIKLKDKAAAKVELEQILKYIPDEEDTRYQGAKSMYDRLR